MKRFSSLFITVFILIACQSQVDVTETIPANTSTPEITLTSTLKPTTQPTTAPQATATPISVEFPDWIKNPDTQIFLAPIEINQGVYNNMALFNAETGEKFDIPFTEEVGDYFWMPDGSKFGFLQWKQSQLIFISTDGNVSFHKTPENAIKFIEPISTYNPNKIQLSGRGISDNNLMFLPSTTELSPDGNYFVYQEACANSYFCVFDVKLKKTTNIFEMKNNYDYFFAEWSPNSQYLAIIEADKQSNSSENSSNFRLKVYDIYTQQLLNLYKNVTSTNWSPDGTKFLFQEWDAKNNSFLSSNPCVFDITLGTTKCYKGILPNVSEPLYQSVQWSPDQTMIGFIYWNSNSGGFCIIQLSSEKTKCILEDLEFKNRPIEYEWSPDSNFISFVYDVCPDCFYRTAPKVAIANIKTGEYFTISYSYYLDTGLWRPSPNP